MSRQAFYLVFLAPVLLHAETIKSKHPGVSLVLSGDGFSADRKLRLSGELKLTCQVEGPQAKEVTSVTIEPNSKLWEVIDSSLDSRDNFRAQSITLAPTQPGTLTLPPVLLRFRDSTTVSWEDVKVEVIGPPPSQTGTIRGEMKPESIPEPPPAPEFPILWLVLGVGGFGLLATGVAFLIRRPRTKITLSPRERALRDLERLREEANPHERLSLILRSHVEECLGFPATRQTTEEILDAARKQNGISEEVCRELEALLAECDRVNFAGGADNPAELERLLGVARDWVEKTSPVAAADSGR